uniref:2'-deoxynucleoside 5'-phosphate N-hydrolase 1 n=1 Tax=Panthera leo TaxID=9689 RepID=A0A8C8WMP1_PANLE
MTEPAKRPAQRHRELDQPGHHALYFCVSVPCSGKDWALGAVPADRTQLWPFWEVLTEHLVATKLGKHGEEAAGGETDRLLREREVAWLQQADVVVAEVTKPSSGVSYELDPGVVFSKRILCVFRPQSAACYRMFQVLDYEEGQVEAPLGGYFEAAPVEQVAASPHPTN